MLDERGAGSIHHLEHQVESVGAPVVGIRYIEVPIPVGVELSEEGEIGTSIILGLEIAQVAEVAAVHREDVVELLEVLGAYAPRPPLECDPVPRRDLGGTGVGRLSVMPRARTRRVDVDPFGEALLLQTVCQDSFSERRTADVAQADEKNGNVVFRGHGPEAPAPRSFGIPVPTTTFDISLLVEGFRWHDPDHAYARCPVVGAP